MTEAREPGRHRRTDDYAPGAEEDVTVPPTDPVREAKHRDVDDPAHVRVDPEEWRQGGPTQSAGAATTTGGRAGPAMRPGAANQDPDDAGR